MIYEERRTAGSTLAVCGSPALPVCGTCSPQPASARAGPDPTAQPAPKTEWYLLHTANTQCLPQKPAPEQRCGALLHPRGPNLVHPAPRPASRHGRDSATEPQALHQPPVLQTRCRTNSSEHEIKPLTHNKAAKELTPAFSLLTVYFSVKYIIYSSIGLIIIYYRLEILSSFPYRNYIINPILHTD